MNVPPHDVLAAGFPCQPFSKSGAQRGMDETRGTLFCNILQIIEERKPKVVLLENVRNLAGPRHMHEWQVIIETLRDEGYRVSETPAIFSPHLLPPERGGRPQVRERVFITATHDPDGLTDGLDIEPPLYSGQPVDGWEPKHEWHLEDLLDDTHNIPGCNLTDSERLWIDAWDEFVETWYERTDGRRPPGFPIWADAWTDVWTARSVVRRALGSTPTTATSWRTTRAAAVEGRPPRQELHALHRAPRLDRAVGEEVGHLHRQVPAVAAQAGVAGAGHVPLVGHRHAPSAVGHPRQAPDLPPGAGRDHADLHRRTA